MADAARVREYRARLAAAGAPVIGISWRSFQPKLRGHIARKKSAPLEAFGALSRQACLVDLQYGDTTADREAFARAGGRLERLDELDLFNDLDGLLAAIEACDLVVTTSNVTAHLGGALGKRTLLVYLAAIPPFHYWVPRANGRSLWYPSVEIVTGPQVDRWERALELAAERIAI
jgi:ADP-heptose:LPS heptosyltransferase